MTQRGKTDRRVNMPRIEVTYKCQCGAEFQTFQGSLRRYCDKCMAKRFTGRPPKKEIK